MINVDKLTSAVCLGLGVRVGSRGACGGSVVTAHRAVGLLLSIGVGLCRAVVRALGSIGALLAPLALLASVLASAVLAPSAVLPAPAAASVLVAAVQGRAGQDHLDLVLGDGLSLGRTSNTASGKEKEGRIKSKQPKPQKVRFVSYLTVRMGGMEPASG